MMTFEELGVSKALTAVLNKRNITAPTPIQQRAYQPVTKGTDVIGCSSTGSGKTLAYLLPVIATAAGQQIYTDVDTCSNPGACSSGV